MSMTSRKKKLLENFINLHFEKEMNILFGEDSEIKIENIKYLTQKKTYLVELKILVTDLETSSESFPYGVEHFFTESCKVLNFFESDPIILSTIDLKKNI